MSTLQIPVCGAEILSNCSIILTTVSPNIPNFIKQAFESLYRYFSAIIPIWYKTGKSFCKKTKLDCIFLLLPHFIYQILNQISIFNFCYRKTLLAGIFYRCTDEITFFVIYNQKTVMKICGHFYSHTRVLSIKLIDIFCFTSVLLAI